MGSNFSQCINVSLEQTQDYNNTILIKNNIISYNLQLFSWLPYRLLPLLRGVLP